MNCNGVGIDLKAGFEWKGEEWGRRCFLLHGVDVSGGRFAVVKWKDVSLS